MSVQVIFPLLSTLSLLHELNIVHLDVKTENIFISASGEVQLGDFGLVAHLLHDPLTESVGTLDYMAPEVISN
jgi:serine/threonine protein kinase